MVNFTKKKIGSFGFIYGEISNIENELGKWFQNTRENHF